jgi:hypothetical protein
MPLQTPEFTVSVAALAVAMLAVNLLLLVYALSPWSSSGGRHRETDPETELDPEAEFDPETDRQPMGPAERRATATEDTDVVRCRDCGTENERTYRYCRQCVSELPVGLSSGDGHPPMFGQVLR